MEYMRSLPDKAFDLAVVDPPYGGGCSQSVHVERERERERERDGLAGGAADWESKRRGRFGGLFDKYYLGQPRGRDLEREISDAHRGRL